MTCSNEDIKRISVQILLLNLRRSYPNLWGITAASWHHHFRRQDLKPFRHHLSMGPSVGFLPMSRCCWKQGGETSSISRSISAKAVFSELAWSNCWKETKLAWKQSIMFNSFWPSFFFFSMFSSRFFLVDHQSDPHLQSHHAVSWRNHSPLALRKWHLQPISQTAKLAFRWFFDTFSENAR